MPYDLSAMLGLKLDEVKRTEFAASLAETPTLKHFEDRHDLVFQDSGIAFIFDLALSVTAIHLYTQGYQGFGGFLGRIPVVTFGDTPRSLRERLGMPSASGGGEVISFFGRVEPWDRYDRG